jgi:predicted RNase H-like HicB family nuclease
MMYHVEIFHYGNGYSALVVEVPGCVAAAATLEEIERLIAEGLRLHLELDRAPEMEFMLTA